MISANRIEPNQVQDIGNKAFKYENIVASAENKTIAAGHMNTLQDLTKKFPQNKTMRDVEQYSQNFGDFKLTGYMVENNQMMVAYKEKNQPSRIIQAYLHGINALKYVTKEALAHFYQLVTQVNNKPPTVSRAPTVQRNLANARKVEDLKQVFETLKLEEKSEDFEAKEAQAQAQGAYWKAGIMYYDDLTPGAQKEVLSQVINVGPDAIVLPTNMGQKFMPQVVEILRQDNPKKMLIIIDPNRNISSADEQERQMFSIFSLLTEKNNTQTLAPDIVNILKNKEAMEGIRFMNVNIDADLISLLSRKPKLTGIGFHQCHFQAKTVDHFLNIIKKLDLQEFVLENCTFSSPKDKENLEEKSKEIEAYRAKVWSFISFSENVQKCEINTDSITQFTPENIDLITKEIKKMTTLKSFDLFGANGLTADGLKKILHALPDTLNKLILSNNNIDDQGAKVIADWLGQNKQALMYIDLQNNRIGVKGLEALVNAKAFVQDRFIDLGRQENNGGAREDLINFLYTILNTGETPRDYLEMNEITDEEASLIIKAKKNLA